MKVLAVSLLVVLALTLAGGGTIAVSDAGASPAGCGDPDFNGNGCVDLSDFINFAKAYMSGNPCFDYDGNGRVDLADLITFANRYMTGPNC
jgi:hypothetical protein